MAYTAAVVGAGMGGKASMKALADSERFELVAVADWKEEARREAGEMHAGVRTFADCGKMFAESPTDVVCVASWPPSHLEVTLGALALPLKGILVEKPLADTAADGARVLDAVKERKLPMAVPHGLLVSVAHGYHGISLMRKYLDVGFEETEVTAFSFASPIVQSPGRDGPPAEEKIVGSSQTIARFDFGDRLGIFDFCGDQYFSHVRGQRLLVRGERGEIIDHGAVFLQDHTTPIRVDFTRHCAGPNGNLEGNYLKGIQAGEEWVYRNPLAPGALADDEIAVGGCLLKMASRVESGEPGYPLAEACQDRYLDIIMQESLELGRPVRTERQPWAG